MAVAFRAAGTSSGFGGAPTVGIPAGTVVGDLLLLIVTSRNQAITTPSGYTAVAGATANSAADGTGNATRIQAYYRIADGSEASFSVADSGDYTVARLFGFSGADTSTPFNVVAADTQAGAASTTVTLPSVTTTVDDCLIVLAIGHGIDSTAAQVSGYTNASLTGITEVMDTGSDSFSGGGLAVAYGQSGAAGAIGSTTATIANSWHSRLTLALQPAVSAPVVHAWGGIIG